jgi:hypothetical protein
VHAIHDVILFHDTFITHDIFSENWIVIKAMVVANISKYEATTIILLLVRNYEDLVLPPTFSQASSDMLTKPWPLQEFLPLHALLAVLQSLWPLHLFTPKHFTSLSDPALTAIGAIENKPAAATANAIPVVLCTFMDFLQQNG